MLYGPQNFKSMDHRKTELLLIGYEAKFSYAVHTSLYGTYYINRTMENIRFIFLPTYYGPKGKFENFYKSKKIEAQN